jgi:hypothetical protein
MNKFRYTMMAFAIVAFTVLASSSARAQATRTWVSGVGDDANPCSRTAPCKTFAGAISKTAQYGEIDALDPGGFGALTITKGITIDGGGGQVASVLVAGTNGIVVQAPATDVVNLVNLRFQGLNGSGSPGLNGIRFLSGKSLNVINCCIWDFSQNGIDIALGASASVYVHNTVVKNCGGAGLAAQTTAGQVKVAIDTSSFELCANGLKAALNSRVSADRSNFSNCSTNGVLADGTTAVGVANITNSSIDNNTGSGVSAQNGGVARINSCDIMANGGNGVTVGAASEVDTFGNNRILANGTDGCPSCTPKGFN